MPGMQAHFQLAFDVRLLEMLTARELSSHIAESCKHQTEKIRTLVHVSGSAEAPLVAVGSVILNIRQCTLSSHTVHQTLLSIFEGLVPRLIVVVVVP